MFDSRGQVKEYGDAIVEFVEWFQNQEFGRRWGAINNVSHLISKCLCFAWLYKLALKGSKEGLTKNGATATWKMVQCYACYTIRQFFRLCTTCAGVFFRFTISVRDILAWVLFLNKALSGVVHDRDVTAAAEMYIHGACLVFLDALGSGEIIFSVFYRIPYCLNIDTNYVKFILIISYSNPKCLETGVVMTTLHGNNPTHGYANISVLHASFVKALVNSGFLRPCVCSPSSCNTV